MYTVWSDYKRMRNEVNSVLRKSKRSFFQNQIVRCNNDPKSMWKCLKILLPKWSVNCPDYIRYNDNDIKGDINIANTFNKYFVDLNKPSDNADDFTYVERTRFTESNCICNEEFVFSPFFDNDQ